MVVKCSKLGTLHLGSVDDEVGEVEEKEEEQNKDEKLVEKKEKGKVHK